MSQFQASSAAAAWQPESIFAWQALPLRFGVGATREIGFEAMRLDMKRVLIVTDGNLVATGLPDRVSGLLRAEGMDVTVWSGSHTEPTEESLRRGLSELADLGADSYVGVGGGSCIDTAKFLNLYQSHPAEISTYLAKPHGDGQRIPGPLRPMIGLPTTSGTGSECTPMALLGIGASHVKAAVSDERLRPRVAIIDPLNVISAPPEVTASAGYDALVQALESFTSLPYDRRPAAAAPQDRPVYTGPNPLSDVWSERAISLGGRFLRRAVFNGDDLEARTGMALAALFSRLGNSGVHLPHAIGYAVANLAKDYRPAGYLVDEPLVPHGFSVIVAAPESFAFSYPAAPQRHGEAARLLGIDGDDEPSRAITEWLHRLVRDTDGPAGLDAVGFTEADIPELAASAITQQRILACSPRRVTVEDLAGVMRSSFTKSRV
ncbi:hydroxyacid-oxoacid transhydrogenase [Jatrophihabitans sp. DSM 45814]